MVGWLGGILYLAVRYGLVPPECDIVASVVIGNRWIWGRFRLSDVGNRRKCGILSKMCHFEWILTVGYVDFVPGVRY